MAIRLATPEDLPAVRICAEDAYAQYVGELGRKPMPMIADFAASQEAGHLFVYETDRGRVVAFIVLFETKSCMFLENVAVLTSETGKGIGKALIGFCEAEAAKRGLYTVELYTNVVMRANLLMYPRLGYEEFDRRTENGFHRVYFRKKLL